MPAATPSCLLRGAALLALATLGGEPAGAGGPAVSCGQVVMANLRLRDDLTCTGPGLVVGAPGLTIDLGGRRLTGDGDPADAGIDNAGGHDGVSIRHGRIEGFGIGVLLSGAQTNTLERLTLERNGTGISLVGTSSGNRLLRNKVFESVLNGISLNDAPANVLERNRAQRNGGNGIYVLLSAANELRRNTASDNENSGMLIGSVSSMLLERNKVDRNLNQGIIVGGPSTSLTLDRNRLGRNGSSGISLGIVSSSVVTGNRLTRNGLNGIELNDGTGNTVSGNSLRSNGLNGILALVATHLIEGNKARRNGLLNGASDGLGLGISAPAGTAGAGNRASGNDDPLECQPASLCQ